MRGEELRLFSQGKIRTSKSNGSVNQVDIGRLHVSSPRNTRPGTLLSHCVVGGENYSHKPIIDLRYSKLDKQHFIKYSY